MIKNILLTALLSATCFAMGCATGGGPSAKKAPKIPKMPPGNQLAVLDVSHEQGSVLKHDQRFGVTVAYQLASVDEAILLARPYTKGRQSSGYLAHQAVPCTNVSGVVETWFTFRQDATIDEIRVTLVDDVARKLLVSITNKHTATWSSKP